jgi:cbb3-type cytochrome oxidase subunit 3
MIRDLLGSIDTGVLSLVGLFAFLIAFAAILVYVFTLRRSVRDAAKQLPLDDAEEIVFNRN